MRELYVLDTDGNSVQLRQQVLDFREAAKRE
jgi:hypothetical protein